MQITTVSTFLGLLLMSYVSTVSAENKVLICKDKLTEEYLQHLPDFYKEKCKTYPDHDADFCRLRDADIAKVMQCRNSKLTYSHKKTFIIDTEALKGITTLFAEGFTETCWNTRTQTKKYSVETTPSSIRLIDDEGSVFNINRVTLKALWDGATEFQCEMGVSEPASQNKL